LLQRKQPGVATGLDDEVRLPWSLRHRQWRPQSAGADRLLDVVELDVRRTARVVLVGPDVIDRQLDLVFELIVRGTRIGNTREVTRVVARVAHQQGLRHEPATLIDGNLVAHDDGSST
jgi:hypothetical protein